MNARECGINMIGKNLKDKLEKLVVLVNKIDEKNYNVHDEEFHNQLIESYANRDEDIFGEYKFSDWLDYLIERYEL